MDQEAREKLEARVRKAAERGEFDEAATHALRGYGGEIYSVLVGLIRDRDLADEAFSLFSENLWRKLRDFEWGCSLRTWAYVVARNAALRVRRDAQRRARRAQPASDSVLEKIVQQVRTETLSVLRTERKTKLRALRDSLPPDDQLLLVLRLDRGLAWNDLVRVMQGADAVSEDELARESARLRKRFQLVKEKLVERARREGLVVPKA